MGVYKENDKQTTHVFYENNIQAVGIKIVDPCHASIVPQKPLIIFERGREIVTGDFSPEVY